MCNSTLTKQPNSTIVDMTAVPFLIDNENNDKIKIFKVNNTERELY